MGQGLGLGQGMGWGRAGWHVPSTHNTSFVAKRFDENSKENGGRKRLHFGKAMEKSAHAYVRWAANDGALALASEGEEGAVCLAICEAVRRTSSPEAAAADDDDDHWRVHPQGPNAPAHVRTDLYSRVGLPGRRVAVESDGGRGCSGAGGGVGGGERKGVGEGLWGA
ncbi:hypothetical protein AXG93_2145s1850 [Marchantia polymorpha subsp. ruderalis]|uniref:Uncharacterized protein n=1 Tax=Marchantia polymorpha subsp. ruderalis TaxID=1480154 RepID=A0A176W0A8_MARPO|nr:hypothetical protein AXG93_2145s1850 [Marchantia polymorpha subsp. ruderalis]